MLSVRGSCGLTVDATDPKEVLEAAMERALDPFLCRRNAYIDGPVQLGLDQPRCEIVHGEEVHREAPVGREVGLECVEAVFREDSLAPHDIIYN